MNVAGRFWCRSASVKRQAVRHGTSPAHTAAAASVGRFCEAARTGSRRRLAESAYSRPTEKGLAHN